MADSLLIFSIGPVQGFIAEARRAQDLYAGSVWLSEVARAALQACLERGAQPIYPVDLARQGLPNRFVVRAPAEQVQATAETAAKAAQRALEQPARQAQAALRGRGPADDVWDDIWRRQLERHLEVYWAAAPLGEGSYQAAYDMANRAFEANKRTRPFLQPTGEEDGLKDSLSGARSALHTGQQDARAYWAAVAKAMDPSILRRDGRERLDSFGATKRFGPFSPQLFPSVSTVAAAPFLLRAASEQPGLLHEHGRNVAELKVFGLPTAGQRLPRLRDVNWPYDGDLLYEETLTAECLQDDYGISPSSEEIARAQDSLDRLGKEVGSRPSRYYAILTMDGDSMGEHVSACANPELHTALSQRLARFAGQATRIIEHEHCGRVVYAGGDDLLAFLAVDDAVPAACRVAEEFTGLFHDWPRDALPMRDGAGLPFTISGGLAIAHHRYPLSAALAQARAAEGEAKRRTGKASLAVHVLVRSGAPTRAVAPWSGLGDQFCAMRDHFAHDRLSPRLAHNLADVAPAFESALLPPEAYAAEVRRVALRQRAPAQMDEGEAKEFAKALAAWAAGAELGPKELAAWLLVAAFVARGGGVE